MSAEDLVKRALAERAEEVSAVPDVDALVARGLQARRRHRVALMASAAAVVLLLSFALASVLTRTAGLAPVVSSPSPPASVTVPASASPARGSAFFAGSANVPVTFVVPSGWEVTANVSVLKSGANPAFGLGFYDVANIYRDGCRWLLLDPPVGPTVDDLVAAYRKLPDLRATSARAVRVDGFEGKQLEFTANYSQGTCRDDTFALVQADNSGTNTGLGNEPHLWAQSPDQRNRALILDVDGTRLVIYALYPAAISEQDQRDLDTILASAQIG